MQLRSTDLTHGEPIDPQFAFGKIDPVDRMTLSDNVSPNLAWKGVSAATRSFALLCVDPDVPSEAEHANQEGKTLPSDMPRVDFYHWVMIDIPASTRELASGECGRGVVPSGKSEPPGPEQSRQGLNDFTRFLAGSEMEGRYFGYDGPCPPWNDERLHHYHYTLYALDVDTIDIADPFDGPAVKAAIEGHVLDQATITGTYTLNPEVG
ncbi:MAG: YbhB/YbcL family Raf kinase inhibitor-like protein [Wenzhouxiangellaceae bacterium]|nr:YbhB/YbcL family Raf kinase inhibitor-like protein [Wenzhouxiangellaceae bacterium]